MGPSELLLRELPGGEGPLTGDHLRRECFINLDELHIAKFRAAPPQRQRGGIGRPHAHGRRVAAGESPGTDAPQNRISLRPRALLGSEHQGRRAIGDLAAVPGSHGPVPPVEDRLELCQGLQGLLGAIPDVVAHRLFIARRQEHRSDFLPEPTRRRGLGHAAVAFQRPAVLLLPGNLVALGEHLRRFSHVQPRHRVREPHLERHHRLEVPRPELEECADTLREAPGAHRFQEEILGFRQIEERDLGHGLHPPRQDEIRLTRFDAQRGIHDRLDPGGAVPVHRVGGNRPGDVGSERHDASDIGGVRRLGDVAEDYLVDLGGIHGGAGQGLGGRHAAQLPGGNSAKGAPGFDKRRTGTRQDDGRAGHGAWPPIRESRPRRRPSRIRQRACSGRTAPASCKGCCEGYRSLSRWRRCSSRIA